jgi:hypothetical protein
VNGQETCHRSDAVLASGKLSIWRVRVNRRAAICLLVILAAAGCRRRGGPDAHYQEALRIYQQLYASELDDAYGDPRIEAVIAELKVVDSNSIDAEAAASLLGTIQRGKEALAADRARRDKMSAAAGQAPGATPIGSIDIAKIIAAGQLAVDAGPPRDPYGPGALVAEINTSTGGCLADGEPFKEQGTNVTGLVYRLAPGAACASKLPGFAGQAVLVVNGRVYRRIPDPSSPGGALQAPNAVPDAGPPPAPRRPAAQAAAESADAGGEARYYYPGQPVPGATPPAEQPH